MPESVYSQRQKLTDVDVADRMELGHALYNLHSAMLRVKSRIHHPTRTGIQADTELLAKIREEVAKFPDTATLFQYQEDLYTVVRENR